ncbi:juvenile hormone esterase-like [Phlebotomus papatasi]|uniref:juvenile hormone esterase-like n=1 Tax=Phlebotomus papatasi TaxID=29031 RepID=UPI002483E21F|nr:juvenile hormone esterase-like [Phlebotomus papatasi]
MKLLLCVLIFCGCSIFAIAQQNFSSHDDDSFRKPFSSAPEVCAASGCIRGKSESGRKKPYDAFYGIPYAEPPIGKLRLENPVPHSGWSGYWDASYARDNCYQQNFHIFGAPISGSEDCLYLNVYRPIVRKSNKKLPVLVYIHGGSYCTYSSDPGYFGPEYLMDNGEVILVTLNYRLGLIGFLCSGDEAVKGNFGLKDQQMALKWVSMNIEYFGGDASSVTLAGQSVGASSVHLHMMNSVSQALFHRAMLLSGTGITPWNYLIDSAAQFRQVAKNMELRKWETGSTYDLAYQFKKRDALDLVLAVSSLFVFPATPPVPVRPCIEGDWEGVFLTEDPRKVWAEGRFVQKPIVIGVTSDEATFAAFLTTNQTLVDTFNANIYDILPALLEIHPRYATKALDFYFGDKHELDDTNAATFFEMGTDRMFRYPLIKLVHQYLTYANLQKNPIYIYEFSFETTQSFVKYYSGQDINLGVSHSDDLFYLFTMTTLFPIFEVDTPESRMSDIYVRSMVNFIARGEFKAWRTFRPCTQETSTPFCDYQIFNRYTKLDPNQAIVSISNEINLEMVKLWDKVDYGVNAISLRNCADCEKEKC